MSSVIDWRKLDNTANLAAIQASRRFPFENSYTALGACIFAGGFSLGMEAAGFKVLGHVEFKDCALGIWPSRQRWPVAVMPNDGHSWMDLADLLASGPYKPDVVYANPPCVAYAGPGKREGAADERMCFTRRVTYEFAMRVQPTVWMWELVPGVFDAERGILEAMAYRASKQGYECHAFLTSSALHGGFQDRRRFHFVATKVGLDFDAVYAAEPRERKQVKTLGDALQMVDGADFAVTNHQSEYTGAFNAIIPFCPPGTHLRNVPPSIMEDHYKPRGEQWSGTGVPGFTHTRGRLDRPCPNVLGGRTVFHPEFDRYLTAREVATVMGFPLNYEFSPGSKAFAEIGRGLCTHNAEFLARVVHAGLEANDPVHPGVVSDGSYMTIHDWRNRAPKLNLALTKSQRNAWWKARHGTELPAEWRAWQA